MLLQIYVIKLMMEMNKKSVIVLPSLFAFNFECTEWLNVEKFLPGRTQRPTETAKYRKAYTAMHNQICLHWDLRSIFMLV